MGAAALVPPKLLKIVNIQKVVRKISTPAERAWKF